jgi:hypothetical protein
VRLVPYNPPSQLPYCCADRVIFAHPCKRPCDLRYARDTGVSLTTFDTESELTKIAGAYPGIQLVLRIRCDDPEVCAAVTAAVTRLVTVWAVGVLQNHSIAIMLQSVPAAARRLALMPHASHHPFA